MSHAEAILARRYATALLRTCGTQFSQEDLASMQRAVNFLKTHKPALYFLHLPDLVAQTKHEIVRTFFDTIKLPPCFFRLVHLLGLHKRLRLLSQVLIITLCLYQEQHNIMDIKIESAAPLNEVQLEIVQRFLTNKSAKTMSVTQAVNKDLIAGIRAQSNTLLWEYSVRKKLRAIRLSVLR